MSKAPNTSCHRHWGNEEERHEDQEPEVAASLDPVAHQHFEQQQQQVDAHRDQHRLELHTRLPFCSGKGQKEKKNTLSLESP